MRTEMVEVVVSVRRYSNKKPSATARLEVPMRKPIYAHDMHKVAGILANTLVACCNRDHDWVRRY